MPISRRSASSPRRSARPHSRRVVALDVAHRYASAPARSNRDTSGPHERGGQRTAILLEQSLHPRFVAGLRQHRVEQIVAIEQARALLVRDGVRQRILRRHDELEHQPGKEPAIQDAHIELKARKAVADRGFHPGGDRIADDVLAASAARAVRLRGKILSLLMASPPVPALAGSPRRCSRASGRLDRRGN